MVLATLFYRENRDGVADVQRPLGGGVFLVERNNVARSRAAGLELVANGRPTKALTYSLSGNLAWSQLDSLGPTYAPTRSLVSAYGRVNLSWQPSANDLLQINGFVNGKRLTPQGYAEPSMAVDLGYRHKFSDRLALVVTAQDPLRSFRLRQVIDTPVLKDVTTTQFDTRQVRWCSNWTFGGESRAIRDLTSRPRGGAAVGVGQARRRRGWAVKVRGAATWDSRSTLSIWSAGMGRANQ